MFLSSLSLPEVKKEHLLPEVKKEHLSALFFYRKAHEERTRLDIATMFLSGLHQPQVFELKKRITKE
jgi:hypothetical protein